MNTVHNAPGRAGVLLAAGLALLLQAAGCRTPSAGPETVSVPPAPSDGLGTHAPVGNLGGNRYHTPANQLLTPAGQVLPLPGLRPQAVALSPDGRLAVTSGKTAQLMVFDAATGRFRATLHLPAEEQDDESPDAVSSHILKPDKTGQLSFTGLVFSPDGQRLYLANVNGSIKVFARTGPGTLAPLRTLRLPTFGSGKRKADIPSGLAVSPDSQRLYVVLNLSNRLLELEAATGRVLRLWQTGMAPFDVKLAAGKAYVSNWGGRLPDDESLTGPAGQGTRVRVDPVRHIASEGSVSVFDLQSGPEAASRELLPARREILTGLHASALAATPGGHWVVVANAGSDTLSVIDTRTDTLIETIWTRQSPADLFGATPNALTFDGTGKTLYVCNGTQNAVAVVDFAPGKSRLRGLIPTAWFPGAVVCDDRRHTLWVANIKGLGSTRFYAPGEKVKYNSHQYYGVLSRIPLPGARQLRAQTATVLHNLRYGALREARLPARPGTPPRPVPERVGEPSHFQQVVYIIKENRTYDQVLGDMPEGNGDPSLCIFGEAITPNHHALAREFALLDNTYCSGILSADGHQWADTGIATDYMERSFAGFPRSYPDGMDDSDVDALAYSPAGFLWDAALAGGKTFRDFGEFAITDSAWRDPLRKGGPKWLDHYREFREGTDLIALSSRPGIASLRPHLVTNTVGWDMDVPDVFRAAQFIRDLKQSEATGQFPHLTLICLPNDHTSGTKVGAPTPAAQVADNDLALGQIVEAISRSRFWSNTCVFVIEDDPQNGWDHVSGYRTVAYAISPYTRRGAVVGTQYNQTSLLRTMELILGLPPMNQMDATATPMSDCFAATPDFTPYVTRTNNVPLDQMNPDPKRITDTLQRRHAQLSARLPLHEVDRCPEDLFNRILWHAMKGSQTPFPEWAVTLRKEDDD
jgi:YVTN family beta-propeller protein